MRVLALDAGSDATRGIVLIDTSPATAGGYTELRFDPTQVSENTVRIASALDAEATLPVALCFDTVLGPEMRDGITRSLAEAGFTSITIVDRAESASAVNPGGGEPAALDDVHIADGLLASHDGLTLGQLAPVVGAARSLLRGSAPTPQPSAHKAELADPPIVPHDDPFTVAESTASRSKDSTAAGAGLAAAMLGGGADDGVDGEADAVEVEDVDLDGLDGPDGGADDGVDGEADAVYHDVVEEIPGITGEFVGDVTEPPGEIDLDAVGEIPGITGEFVGDETLPPAGSASTDHAPDDLTMPRSDVDPLAAPPPIASSPARSASTDHAPDDLMMPRSDVDPLAAPPPIASVAEGSEPDSFDLDPAPVVGVPDVDADAGNMVTQPPTEPLVAAAPAAPLAARAATTRLPGTTPYPRQREEERSKPWPLFLVGAVVLIALLAFALSQCGGGDDSTSSTAEPTAEPAESAVQESETAGAPDALAAEPTAVAEPTTVAEPTAVAEPTTVAEPTAVPEPTPEPTVEPTPEPEPTDEPTPEPEATADPLAGLPPLDTLPERGAIFRPPTLFLEGPVATQEEADALFEAAAAVVGPDNVVNNYIVRPDAPPTVDGTIRVEQAVLFQTGSAAIADDFIATLELGVAVMALNPQVQMVVQGHTDSVGDEADNQALSERRAEAVVAYLEGRGVPAERLQAVGFGEGSPVADNDTEAGREINRRIEVELLDLLTTE